MRYAIVGAGRMGQAIEVEATARGHECVARIGRPVETAAAAGLCTAGLGGVETAFEFTTADAAEANVLALLEAGVSVVCGTTGWQASPAVHAALEKSDAACVLAPNFSIGMLLFSRIVERAAGLFGPTGLYDAWIHESHHREKRDAPSGTARRLARIVVDADPRLSRAAAGAGGSALGGLPLTATRAGHDPGRHVVGFDGAHDRITLEHQARSRAGFALGAVLAAEYVHGRRGLISMDRVVDRLLAAEEAWGDAT